MADVSSIKLPNGAIYTVKDSAARYHIGNGSNPHGVTKSQVGLGNVANYDQSKAIKSISRSGTTFTATALDGTTFTFTQQDNNTTYGVATQNANGLMSSADKTKLDSLSATSVSAITNSEIDLIVAS
nr:MAG TPA: Minor structural protein [Caudoviricetes sp.]